MNNLIVKGTFRRINASSQVNVIHHAIMAAPTIQYVIQLLEVNTLIAFSYLLCQYAGRIDKRERSIATKIAYTEFKNQTLIFYFTEKITHLSSTDNRGSPSFLKLDFIQTKFHKYPSILVV